MKQSAFKKTPKLVFLCDKKGGVTGSCDLNEAHSGKGKLHKAFSVFVFCSGGKEMLIQKRSRKKKLWPGIWANACCSHLRKNEDLVEAGQRRLKEECGFTVPLKEITSFVYRAEDPGGNGVEYEHDTILAGTVDENVNLNPDPDEVAQLKWVKIDELHEDMKKDALKYAPWFHLGLHAIMMLLKKG